MQERDHRKNNKYTNRHKNIGAPLVRDLPNEWRPREKCLQFGVSQLTTEELVAILLRTGRKGQSVLALAKELVGSLTEGAYGLNQISLTSLQEIKGIGPDKAVTLVAAVELGRRLGQMRVKQQYADFSHPEAVATYVMERLRHEPVEHFCVAMLTNRNQLIALATVAIGGLTASQAEQRVVFRKAIEANAASIILLHNHPSGDPRPSQSDIQVTQVFQQAGEIMGIPVLDHIIIGDGVYESLAELGYL